MIRFLKKTYRRISIIKTIKLILYGNAIARKTLIESNEKVSAFFLQRKMIYAQYAMFKLRFFDYRESVYKASDNRRYYEYCLLPFFRIHPAFKRILFTGVGSFTQHYPVFFQKKELVKTIDIQPELEQLFPGDTHITDSVTNIEHHVPAEELDLVLMNGVYGWGLDSEGELAKALDKIFRVMRPGGMLVFGWNDSEERDPLKFRDGNWQNFFKQFRPFEICRKSILSLQEPHNQRKHIFHFYIKSEK